MNTSSLGPLLLGGNEGDCLYAPPPMKCLSKKITTSLLTKEKLPWCPCLFKNEATGTVTENYKQKKKKGSKGLIKWKKAPDGERLLGCEFYRFPGSDNPLRG